MVSRGTFQQERPGPRPPYGPTLTFGCLSFRLIVVLFLLFAKNVEDLVYWVWLLLSVRLLALIGSRILFPQQVPQDARGPAQWIVRTRHQALYFHLGNL